MPNAKISALPAASTLNGSELLEVVQSGANKKATASQLKTFSSGTGGAAGALAPGAGVIPLFGIVTELTSGAGSLSGIATAGNATPIPTAVLFTIAGLPQGWYLSSGTAANGSGIQRPDDYNASTNQRNWIQFL